MHICWYISSRAFPVHSEIYLQNVTFATDPKQLNCYKKYVFWKFEVLIKMKCHIRIFSSEHFYCRWASYFGRWFLVNLLCTMNHKPWWQHRVIEPLAVSIIKWSKQMGWIIPWNTNWKELHGIMKSYPKTVIMKLKSQFRLII